MIDVFLSMLGKIDCAAIICHISPDGDTIGSAIALKFLLESRNISIGLFCDDKLPARLSFIKGIEQFNKESSKSYDMTIAIDCSDLGRLGKCIDLYERGIHKVNIDHHISNESYADINIIDSDASATGEIIYSMIEKAGIIPDINTANSMYTAIATDTGNFSYSNTTSNTLSIASKLVGLGIDIDNLTRNLFRSRTKTQTMMLAKCLNTLEFYNNDKVAVISVNRDLLNQLNAKDSDIQGIINYALEIRDVEVALLFKEADDSKTKVGFRSKYNLDVSKLASIFGGGGHKKAAGCLIQDSIEMAKKIILEHLFKYYKEI